MLAVAIMTIPQESGHSGLNYPFLIEHLPRVGDFIALPDDDSESHHQYEVIAVQLCALPADEVQGGIVPKGNINSKPHYPEIYVKYLGDDFLIGSHVHKLVEG